MESFLFLLSHLSFLVCGILFFYTNLIYLGAVRRGVARRGAACLSRRSFYHYGHDTVLHGRSKHTKISWWEGWLGGNGISRLGRGNINGIEEKGEGALSDDSVLTWHGLTWHEMGTVLGTGYTCMFSIMGWASRAKKC